KYGTVSFNHQCFITHNREVSSSGNTGSHNSCNLSNSHGTHSGIVPEYPSKMFLVGKYFILHRKKNPCAVYQVNNGKSVFHRYFLHPQVLFARYRKPCPGFNRLVVSHYHALPSTHISDPGYGTTSRTTTV